MDLGAARPFAGWSPLVRRAAGNPLASDSGRFGKTAQALALSILLCSTTAPGSSAFEGAQDQANNGGRETEAIAEKDDTVDPQLETFRHELTVRARPLATPASAVTVIERDAIEASGARTVGQLLSQVPGVHLIGNGSRGGLASAQIRGGDSNFSLVLVDGILLNNPTDLEGGAFNTSSLPVSQIERIEVARGPHSYFYGPNALSGLINIVTRRGGPSTPRVTAAVETGEFSLLRVDSSISGVRGEGDYFVGIEWQEEEGRLENDAFEQLNLVGSFGIPLGERSKLRLSTRMTSWDADDYPDASGGPVFGSGELRRSENDELSLGADLVVPSTEHWRQRFSATWHDHDLSRTSPGVAPLVPPSFEDIAYSRFRGGWLSSFDLSSTLLLSGGLDVEAEDATNNSALILPPMFGGEIPGDYSLSRTTVGLFAELVAEHRNLLFEAGVRADNPEDGSTEWSPRVAVRYRFGDSGTALRGTVSQAFKLPSFLALASPPALGGNPDLRPETSEGADLGLVHRFKSGRGSFQATLFWTRYEDLIEFDFDVFQNVNRSRVEAQGIETAISWAPSSELRLTANLTWQDVEDLDISDTPLHQPEWLGGATIFWQPLPPLTVSLVARLVSESLDQQLTVLDRNSVSGYQTLDASAAWSLSDSWQLRATVENLTDEEYENFIGFPEPGISARLQLRYRLAARGEPGS